MTRRRWGRPRRCRRAATKERRRIGWARSSRTRSREASWSEAPRRGVSRRSRRRNLQSAASSGSGGSSWITGG
eukprot:11696290-Alexandrium_andersonii.AAC.1